MNTKNITKGHAKTGSIDPTGVIIDHVTVSQDAELKDTPLNELKENAELIAEAFNVANETGKSPRELVEIIKNLGAACGSAFNELQFKSHDNPSIMETLRLAQYESRIF